MARTKIKNKVKVETVTKQPDEPGLMKFRVVKGTHYEIDRTKKSKAGRCSRKRFVSGDVVESYRELDKIFKNKFQRVSDDIEETIPVRSGFRTLNRGGDRYDVLNEKTGTIINEEFLTLEQAKELERAAGGPIDKFPSHLQDLLYQPQKGKTQMPDGSLVSDEEGLVE